MLRRTEPTPLLSLTEMAQRLSNLRRFCGHPRALTVLQHSMLTALLAQRSGGAVEYAALIHDMAEAYTNDLPRMLKNEIKRLWPHALPLPWQQYEDLIRESFWITSLPWPESAVVYYDDLATALEMSRMVEYASSDFVASYEEDLLSMSLEEQRQAEDIYTESASKLCEQFIQLIQTRRTKCLA